MSGISVPTIDALPADWTKYSNLIHEGFASYKQIGIEIIERRLIIKKGSRFCFRKKLYCVYDDEELSIPELPSTTDIYFLYLNYNEDENSFYFTVSVMEPPLTLTQGGWMRGADRRLMCILRYYKTKLVDYIDEKQIKNPPFSMLNLTPGNDRLRSRLQGFFNFTLNGAGGGGGGNDGMRQSQDLSWNIVVPNRGSKGGNGGQVRFFTYIDEPVNLVVGYGGGGGPSGVTTGYYYIYEHPYPITAPGGPAFFNPQIGRETIVGGAPEAGKNSTDGYGYNRGSGSGAAPGGVTLLHLLESNILFLAQSGAGGGGGGTATAIGGDAPMGHGYVSYGHDNNMRDAGDIDYGMIGSIIPARPNLYTNVIRYTQKWYNRLPSLIYGEMRNPEGGKGGMGFQTGNPSPPIDGGNGGNGEGAPGGAISQNGGNGNILLERWT
jgi:hypothetical protein